MTLSTSLQAISCFVLLTLAAVFQPVIVQPTSADDCLMDTSNDGNADSNVDTDSNADSSGVDARLACGTNADASGSFGTAVGAQSVASDSEASAFGNNAVASGRDATALGSDSLASGNDSTAIGEFARASGLGSTALGDVASATAENSTAVGYSALASQPNSVVLGSIQGLNGASNYADVGIGTNQPAAALHIRRGDGVSIYLQQDSSASTWSIDHRDSALGGGLSLNHTPAGSPNGVEFTVETNGDVRVGGNLTVASDVNAKGNIEPLRGDVVLSGLDRLQISEWSYKASPQNRHIGPMAQDFYRVFRLGDSDRHISPSDMAGVNMAAIKAIASELDRIERENAALRARQEQELTALRAANEELMQRIAALEGRRRTGS